MLFNESDFYRLGFGDIKA